MYSQRPYQGIRGDDVIVFESFWQCPRNILPHNVFLATQLDLAPGSALMPNTIGLVGILTLSYGVAGTYGLYGMAAAVMVPWFLILLIPTTKQYFVSPEFQPYVF